MSRLLISGDNPSCQCVGSGFLKVTESPRQVWMFFHSENMIIHSAKPSSVGFWRAVEGSQQTRHEGKICSNWREHRTPLCIGQGCAKPASQLCLPKSSVLLPCMLCTEDDSQHLLQSVSQLPLNSGLAHTHPRHLRGAQQEGCPKTASLMSHSQVLFILPLPFFSNSPLPAAPAVQAWPFLSLLPTALEISLPCCPLLDLD